MVVCCRLLCLLSLCLLSGKAFAAVRLPHILGDHMVLQRDAPIHIWGWADAGETVRVTLDGASAQDKADALGGWSVYLKPHAAGGPYAMTVQGSGASVTVNDLMIGDLWIASGQSNMEMPLSGWANAPMNNSAQEIAAANHPELRLVRLQHTGSDYPMADANVTWSRCTPETAKEFSAVAYFFGRAIAQDQHVAIGLIDSTWGGTPAESWTSIDAFGTNASLAPVWAQWSRFTQQEAIQPATIAAEKREDAERARAGKPPVSHPWHPPAEAYRPSSLYNGMIAPLTPLSIRGVIWYQGETNSRLDRSVLYHALFASLIQDWRNHFQQGPFPFLFAQISSFRSTPEEAWGVVRDAQRRTLELASTAMAVTLDVGTPGNVHPPDKQTVGARLALAARRVAYGEPVHDAGPLFARADVEDHALRVGFQDRSATLRCKGPTCGGFEIAGSDHKFVPAEASIDGSSVIVHSSTVAEPRFVRYAWTNAPVEANLEDSTGLPCSTFTSESEIGETGPGLTAH